MRYNGAQLIIEALKAEEVENIFGVSGSPTLPILDFIYNEPQIRYIQTQHEQGAIYMANGYARARKTASICLVSPGPGITNCLSGVAQAFYTSTPSLLISVEEDSEFSGLGSSLHHDLQAVAIFKPVTKLALRVERISRLLEGIRTAFRTALSGRKGPVYLGIAENVLTEQADVEMLTPQKYRFESLPQSDPNDITKAVDLLLTSERSVILAGGGVSWAKAQDVLLELAEVLAVPVATTRHNKGLVPEDHPMALGTVGHSSTPFAVKTMQESDVILAIGCTFDRFTTKSFGHQIIPKDAKIIQVDIDPTELGKIYPVEIGIWGDARHVLQAIREELVKRKVNRKSADMLPRIKKLLKAKKQWQESLMTQRTSSEIPIRFFRLLHDLRKALPRDAIVTGASGGTLQWFDYAFQSLNHTLAGWGAIGSDYPENLGVKVAMPDRVVACIIGDGGMMMTLQEIATAVAYNIPLLCVVCHNNVYGNMRYTQIKNFGSRFIGTNLQVPNLANIAREFGAYGERVEDPDKIISIVNRALESGKPALIEIMMDTSPENLVPPAQYFESKNGPVK